MSDISERLAAARRGWRDAETAPPGAGGGDLPDGRYQVEIDAGSCVKEDKNGGVGILWKLTVLRGEEKGKTQTKWVGLLDKRGELLPEERIKWVKRDFATLLGEPLEDIREVESTIEDLIGKETEIEVKTRGEFTNVYFCDEATTGEEDDDLPKRKAARADDDEDEEPPRRKAKDDDDDEEEPPRRKSKAKDDDDEEDDERSVKDLLKKNRPKR